MSNTLSYPKVVDFAPFLDSSKDDGEKRAAADAILDSFRRTGFVYLTNHGISIEQRDGICSAAKNFFAQPMEKKMLAPHPPSGMHHRGYSAPGVEKVVQETFDPEVLNANRAKAPDVKESYEIGRENDEVMPNIWPPEDAFPGFRKTCMGYYWTCNDLKLTFLRALAIALRIPENYFDQYHKNADNQLRLLHYPSVATSSLLNDQIVRIGAHTDFCSITFLIQDDIGGLEVENPNHPGEFIPVTPVKDTIIVNAGDFLMRWSNDLIKSTVHRVRVPQNLLKDESSMTPDRYSIVYFCATDLSTTVDCIPGTYSEENPKKYEPISAMEYIMKRLAANY